MFAQKTFGKPKAIIMSTKYTIGSIRGKYDLDGTVIWCCEEYRNKYDVKAGQTGSGWVNTDIVEKGTSVLLKSHNNNIFKNNSGKIIIHNNHSDDDRQHYYVIIEKGRVSRISNDHVQYHVVTDPYTFKPTAMIIFNGVSFKPVDQVKFVSK